MRTSLPSLGLVALLTISPGSPADAAQGERRVSATFQNITIAADETVSSLAVNFGQAHVNGVVNGAATVSFGDLHVSGPVNGPITATCAQVTVTGAVGEGGIEARFGDVIVDGVVKGPVMVTAGNVRLGKDGRIEGRVTIHAGSFKGDRSRVAGGVVVDNKIHLRSRSDGGCSDHDALEGLLAVLLLGCGLLAIGWWMVVLSCMGLLFYLLLALIFRGTLERRRLLIPAENVGLDFLAGVLAIGGAFMVSIVLCVSCVGIPLLAVVGMASMLAYWFGMLTLAYILGGAVWKHLFKRPAGYWATILAGLVTIFISRLVPLLGGMLNAFYFVLAIGITARWIYEARRVKSPPVLNPPSTQP
ncbi:MAG: polymer-forming cytoskeletal protein [Verrucomicrobia bacterium]|nr:polymer-forming cytoskeletal protein [Verrucomicrobiota bacterium]